MAKPSTNSEPNQPNKMTIKKKLSHFIERKGPILLQHSKSAMNFSFPVSNRININKATLHLEYTNSISLLQERSQMQVLLNNTVLAQLPLKAKQPHGEVDIILPAQDLKPGYNEIMFKVAQHYTNDCEDGRAPELWTQIDTLKSYVTYDYDVKKMSPTVQDLADILKPESVVIDNVYFVMGSSEKISPDQLTSWGGHVAQGLGVFYEYLPMKIHHGKTLGAKGDHFCDWHQR